MEFTFNKKAVKIGDYEFHLTELSARARQVMFALYKDDTDPISLQANYIRLGCDELKDMSIDEILDGVPGTVLTKLSERIIEFNGLNVDSVEDAEKN